MSRCCYAPSAALRNHGEIERSNTPIGQRCYARSSAPQNRREIEGSDALIGQSCYAKSGAPAKPLRDRKKRYAHRAELLVRSRVQPPIDPQERHANCRLDQRRSRMKAGHRMIILGGVDVGGSSGGVGRNVTQSDGRGCWTSCSVRCRSVWPVEPRRQVRGFALGAGLIRASIAGQSPSTPGPARSHRNCATTSLDLTGESVTSRCGRTLPESSPEPIQPFGANHSLRIFDFNQHHDWTVGH